MLHSENISSEQLQQKVAELQTHFEKEARLTPLLFNRTKTEKQLVMTFIKAYYTPIINQKDIVSTDEQHA